jgi:hypothetical protein
VTRVEEWTREETGVGAAMAAGNQDIKGNWALLVILNKNKIIVNNNIWLVLLNKRNESKNKKIMSPTRFLKKVNNLLLIVFQFL